MTSWSSSGSPSSARPRPARPSPSWARWPRSTATATAASAHGRRRQEVWQFEIFGPGPAEQGAVWAAKRIPPGEVGVSANRSRITTLTTDPNFTMPLEERLRRAESMGWWKKGDPFLFNRIFGMSGAPTPNRREWRVLSILAPSLKLDPWAPEQPFSVKPDKKVTVRTDGDPSRRLCGDRSSTRPKARWPARSARRTAGRCLRATGGRPATRRPSG